jgi:hypothetical protein
MLPGASKIQAHNCTPTFICSVYIFVFVWIGNLNTYLHKGLQCQGLNSNLVASRKFFEGPLFFQLKTQTEAAWKTQG